MITKTRNQLTDEMIHDHRLHMAVVEAGIAAIAAVHMSDPRANKEIREFQEVITWSRRLCDKRVDALRNAIAEATF